ncbi:hypothetical protein [Collinsella sp. Sow4_E3]|uniref:hypothetical protein n=1 Tax=Collinsella sp. Sow4_E3 TaxID=3438776 RepID=UPI003F91295A
MIDTHDATPCASGCITYRHLADCTDDHCSGCEPRWATDGLLCGRCHNRLATLLSGPNDPESIAGVCAWLADNLGQHLRSPSGKGEARPGGDSDGQFARVFNALSAAQIVLASWARDWADHSNLTGPSDTNPATVAAWLRPWLPTLCRWEPVAVMLDELADARRDAHTACPWRSQPRVCAGVACPHCHDTALVIPAGETDTHCRNCGLIVPERDYARWIAVLGAEAELGPELTRKEQSA